MEHQFDTPDFGAGHELVTALQESGVISEASAAKINSMVLLTENVQNTPNSYVYNNHFISWELFKTVYTSYDKYPDIEDVWKALGYPRGAFSGETEKKKRENMSKSLRRIVDHFQEKNREAREILVTPAKRETYSNQNVNQVRRKTDYEEDDVFGLNPDYEPSMQDIDPGRRGRITRATRTIERINSQQLLSGQFYSDFSRIPPTRWGNWLRFWDKQKSPVRQKVSLFGRSWKKTFVLGYQIEPSLVYEIWYDSLDSSFALYDFRGSQLTRAFPTLSEATKAMMNALAQRSNRDAEFFSSGINNRVATSIFRSMTNDLDSRIDDLRRLEDKEQKDAVEAQKRREEENAKRKELGNLEYFRQKVASAAPSGKDVETAKRWAGAAKDVVAKGVNSDLVTNGILDKAIASINSKIKEPATKAQLVHSLEQIKAGRLTLSRFAQEASNLFDVAGDPRERQLRAMLVSGDIGVAEYVDALKDLSERTQRVKNRNTGTTEIRPQPTSTGEPRQQRVDLRRTWDSEGGEYSVRTGDMTGDTPVSFSIQSKEQDDAISRYEKAKIAQLEKMKSEEQPKKKPARKRGKGKPEQMQLTFESILDDVRKSEMQKEFVDEEIDSGHTGMIRRIRDDAQNGQFTQKVLKSNINSELISTYNQTRVDNSFPNRIMTSLINRGRRDPVVLPTDKPGILDRVKLLVRGHKYHADFIVGFSLRDAVNIEIWYVVEPNPEYSFNPLANNDGVSPTVSSFYVFDVTSGRLIRKYVPYYRNAVQIAMAKLSAQ